MTTITGLLNTAQHSAQGLSVNIDASWMQGRSAYGGLQALLAAEAMQKLADGLPIRTLQGTLIEPLSGQAECQAQLIRSSKNTRQIEARLTQDGQTKAIFLGIFGRSRESIVEWAPQRRLQGDKELVWPYVEGITPQFLQNFEVCMLKGHTIASGQPDTEHLFRLSLKDDVGTTELAQVLALSDFPPPIGMSWAKTFKPGSTMTWMLNFTGHPVEGHSLKNWECEVVLDSARDGYNHQTVSLYAPSGELILRGTQCMVVFL